MVYQSGCSVVTMVTSIHPHVADMVPVVVPVSGLGPLTGLPRPMGKEGGGGSLDPLLVYTSDIATETVCL